MNSDLYLSNITPAHLCFQSPRPITAAAAAVTTDSTTDGDYLSGRPLQPHNTPVPSESDYNKYQRVNTPDLNKGRALPKPRPPPIKAKHNGRYGNVTAETPVVKPKADDTKHKQGNDILTVEIERKPEKKARMKSSESSASSSAASDTRTLVRRRSLKNILSASSSQDLEAEVLPPGDKSGRLVALHHDILDAPWSGQRR